MKRILTTYCVLIALSILTFNAFADSNNHNKHRAHAATMWWVIFNNPDACFTNPGAVEKCGPPDVFGPEYLASVAQGDPNPALITPNADAQIGVVYATGAVSDRRNGRIRFNASIYRTPDEPLNLAGDQVVDPLGLGRGFNNLDAEIHLVVRDHGRARRDGLFGQLTNFLEPLCSDPNLLFEGGKNICVDIHTSVYGAGESGEDVVTRFSDGSEVRGAQTTLIRQGDMVLVMVETRIPDRRKKRKGRRD